MAQVTNDMCDHIIAYADRGERFPLTVNELRQIAYLARARLTSLADARMAFLPPTGLEAQQNGS